MESSKEYSRFSVKSVILHAVKDRSVDMIKIDKKNQSRFMKLSLTSTISSLVGWKNFLII